MEIDINGLTILAFGCGVLVGLLVVFCFTTPLSSVEVVAGNNEEKTEAFLIRRIEELEREGGIAKARLEYEKQFDEYCKKTDEYYQKLQSELYRIEALEAELTVENRKLKAQVDGLSERVRQLAIENKV